MTGAASAAHPREPARSAVGEWGGAQSGRSRASPPPLRLCRTPIGSLPVTGPSHPEERGAGTGQGWGKPHSARAWRAYVMTTSRMQTISEKKVTPSMRLAARDHRSANVAGGAGLAGDALHGRRGQAADAGGTADDGESRADAGGEVRHDLGIHCAFLLSVRDAQFCPACAGYRRGTARLHVRPTFQARATPRKYEPVRTASTTNRLPRFATRRGADARVRPERAQPRCGPSASLRKPPG